MVQGDQAIHPTTLKRLQMAAIVTAVSRSKDHTFSKLNDLTICLVVGHGIEGDAHMGEKVKHRSHIRKHGPNMPNLRQVHLIHEELFGELRDAGFDVWPGALGENVTTRGIDLLALPLGTRLRLGARQSLRLRGCEILAGKSRRFVRACYRLCSDAIQEAISSARLGSWRLLSRAEM